MKHYKLNGYLNDEDWWLKQVVESGDIDRWWLRMVVYAGGVDCLLSLLLARLINRQDVVFDK